MAHILRRAKTIEEQYRLGAKPSRPDLRDYDFRTLIAPRAAEVAESVKATDRKNYTMVGPDFRINQGNEGTCVGHGHTNDLLAGLSTHATYPDFQTSELAHQFARRLYFESTGDSTYQEGAYPRDACDTLLRWGLIESYWKVMQVEDIITCLLTFGPVGIAVPWYDSMYFNNGILSNQYGNQWIKCNFKNHVGYHFLALTGIDLAPDNGAPPYVRVQNSWGPGWLQNGTARLTIEYLRQLNIWDNWAYIEKPF